ncbi:hypothetical protein GQX73_g5018 [Xylaria multiplex]|uniref:DUF8032 domain-containing protein n=1 Tax=Xylaria multiplex TaxID=323545 RepID=A0A7C8IQ69_9PEZI|nr:hypothetical protein GQX73_g5018 [Xylaria multiplex]
MVVTSMQHHPHHSQGPAPPQHLQQHTRPSSIVHQQHHQAPSAQSQHPSAYSSHSIQPYQASSHSANAQHTQDIPYYAHQSPYSTPGTTSGYTSADTSDMMAAAQMPRPYPPIYHTPQSNSPASVASPSTHEHRSIYGQPPSQLQHQSMYYGTQQQQYSSMAQQAPSPYQQHAQQHAQQSMTSQPSLMMSQTGPQHQIPQHASQHAQTGMTGSPRHAKLEPQMTPQLQRPGSGPLGTPQPNQNGGQLSTPTGSSTPGINNNAAPGPIPATTPLVVRQDNNGVQWIAFEYSRDRVKMEYTIRCDVESVNTDELGSDFRTENCVYPRACCSKDQYRGNRLQYETECNTVGWALAQLNPCLRGKRGLIQRAVDSWRNSNQDPRLRSRRVRRMAKMNNRKTVQPPHSTHIPGPSGPTGLSTPGALGPGSAAPLGKPGMSSMASQMHHHHAHEGSAPGGGDEVGDGEYMDESHHHHQAPGGPGSGSADDVRPSHVFAGYSQQYPSHATSASSIPPMHDGLGGGSHHGPIAAKRHNREEEDVNPEGLFPDIPESKKRKFILVDDNKRGGRLRVRVQLEGVDTKEIPDSFRKRSAVFPRSYFPREMQDPPPSATGSRFFEDDLSDHDVEVDSGRMGRSRTNRTRDRVLVKVPMANGIQGEVAIPRMRNSIRTKEVRLNDLGYRMAWLNGRPFAGRTIFMQRALDCYRNKTRGAAENAMMDIKTSAPHYETRVGKRRWNDRMSAGEKLTDDA